MGTALHQQRTETASGPRETKAVRLIVNAKYAFWGSCVARSPPLGHVVMSWGLDELPEAKGRDKSRAGKDAGLKEVSQGGVSEDFGAGEAWMGLSSANQFILCTDVTTFCLSSLTCKMRLIKVHLLALLASLNEIMFIR